MTVVAYRPFYPKTEIDMSWWERVNIPWWLQRIPMALLTIPAAYGVAEFASERMVSPFDWVAGIAFEAAYIGAVALADQQKDTRDRWTIVLWVAVNLIAVVCSALMNTLFFAGGEYENVDAEAITHGVPFAVLNFGYALLLHAIVAGQQRQESRKVEREETWRDTKLMTEIQIEKIRADEARLKLEERQLRLDLRRTAAPSAKSTIVPTTQGTTNLRVWTCKKCGATHETTGSPRHRESISVRHGCPVCKVKRIS